jgi:hypothetical protein
MKQMRLTKLAIAGSTFACSALFSFSWFEQQGVSLSVESAQARVGRPCVAGVARRQDQRAASDRGPGQSAPASPALPPWARLLLWRLHPPAGDGEAALTTQVQATTRVELGEPTLTMLHLQPAPVAGTYRPAAWPAHRGL